MEVEGAITETLTLSREEMHDNHEQVVGYTYILSIPERLCEKEGGEDRCIYSSCDKKNPLDTELHDAQAKKQQTIHIEALQRQMTAKGFVRAENQRSMGGEKGSGRY